MSIKPRLYKLCATTIKLLLYIVVLSGVCCIYNTLDKLSSSSNVYPPETIEVTFSEEEKKNDENKLSFEEHCKRNPVSTCFDNSQPTDFMYEEKPVAIIQSEEFAPEKLAQNQGVVTLGEDLIADFIEENIDLATPENNVDIFANIHKFDNDKIEDLYEEELPDDVVEAKQTPQKKQFLPSQKPPYFGEHPVIAVVIDDMGISQKRTADIISLKAPLTSSFLTYGRKLDEQISNAQNSGHEIMIHVPMEAQSNKDVAPDVLTTQMSKAEIQNNLKQMLAKFKNIKGINNHMGSKLTEDKERMTAIMEVLKEHNLFFLDSKTSAKSKAEDAAKEAKIAYAHRHVFIDNKNDKQYILGQLQKVENVAQKNGYAIAIGHPKSQTFEALKEWLPNLQQKGIKLLPLSHIVQTLNPNIKNLKALPK